MFFLLDDPFGIIYNENCLAEPSEDVVTCRKFNKYPESKNSSSFIFGNSRVHCFNERDLSEFFRDKNVFSFGAPGESILNMRRKLEMIISKGNKIKNALILVDEGILLNTNNGHPFFSGPVYNHTPETSDISTFRFYAQYLRYYFSDLFFIKHIYYRITGNYVAGWMSGSFKEQPERASITVSAPPSDARRRYADLADSLLENNFSEYKKKYSPDYSDNFKNIGFVNEKDIEHLAVIKQFLEKHAERYIVLIPPSFHKHKLSKNVLHQLDSVFGKRIFDFTGINRISTDTLLNYENLHFTQKAGKMVLDSIREKYYQL